jgi:peptidoglycan/LPS O-acetylase OafA/YrhL
MDSKHTGVGWEDKAESTLLKKPEFSTVSRAFRADINGLRSFAVLSVIAFHFGIWPISGGFVGVDIFFVISGYLMTGIILERVEKGTFSIPDFYLDRASRIVPPLAALCLALIVFGYHYLLPDEYLILGKHAASSVLFSSNILYFLESSYFDPQSEGKWLLHTWSLSVEWQFYLLYPIIVVLSLKAFGRKAFIFPLIFLALSSFCIAMWDSRVSPRAGFFLLPPRAWEMMVGGIVYLAEPLGKRTSRFAQLAGLMLIAASIFGATAEGWPNAWTILPVLGAALVILAARTDSRITGNLFAKWIGLRSYSIYLWHWPIAVLLRRSHLFGAPLYVVGAITVSLVLGHISWRLIEQGRSRQPKLPIIHVASRRWNLGLHGRYLIFIGIIAIASSFIWIDRGLPGRFPSSVQILATDAAPGSPYSRGCFSEVKGVPSRCIVGKYRDREIVTMIGDSHAESTISALVAALPSNVRGGVAFNGYAACAPLLDGRSTDPESQCGAFNERYLRPLVHRRQSPLILVAYWNHYFENPTMLFNGGALMPSSAEFGEHIVRSSCELANAGPTYLLLPTPEFPFEVAHEMQHRLISDPSAKDIVAPVSEYYLRNRNILAFFNRAKLECGVKLLDPIPYLCPRGVCLGTVGGRAVYRDEHHLSEFGNKLLIPLFRTVKLEVIRDGR